MTDTIICPNCGSEIPVSETLTDQIRQQLRRQFDQEQRQKEADLVERLEGIQQKELQLEASRLALEQEVSARVAREQTRLAEEARVKALESVALEVSDLEAQLAEAKDKIVEGQKAELQLRKDRRD